MFLLKTKLPFVHNFPALKRGEVRRYIITHKNRFGSMSSRTIRVYYQNGVYSRLSTAESNQTNKAQSYTRTNIWGPQIFVKCGKYHAHTSTRRPSHKNTYPHKSTHHIFGHTLYTRRHIKQNNSMSFGQKNYYLS